MGKQKQQMQGYHPCQGTDRGVVEIRDSKFYDGEPAWFPEAKRPTASIGFTSPTIIGSRTADCADHTRASRPRRRLPSPGRVLGGQLPLRLRRRLL